MQWTQSKYAEIKVGGAQCDDWSASNNFTSLEIIGTIADIAANVINFIVVE
jgi:hypothetical protein